MSTWKRVCVLNLLVQKFIATYQPTNVCLLKYDKAFNKVICDIDKKDIRILIYLYFNQVSSVRQNNKLLDEITIQLLDKSIMKA